MATKTLDQRIVETPGVCGGQPRIDGHRITVKNVAIWHDRLGWSADEIANEYRLELADVHAALAYYFARQGEIDQAIASDEAFVEEMRRKSPSLVRQKLTKAEESVLEVAARLELAGCLQSGVGDLATNPDHMEGFGRDDY